MNEDNYMKMLGIRFIDNISSNFENNPCDGKINVPGASIEIKTMDKITTNSKFYGTDGYLSFACMLDGEIHITDKRGPETQKYWFYPVVAVIIVEKFR